MVDLPRDSAALESQAHALKLFVALALLRPSWTGALIVGVGLGSAGRPFALATLASGAAGLFLESDPGTLRTAQRENCCTFQVSRLDEAVRILKNEIRQGRGVTVALSGEPSQALHECVTRGLQPQMLAFARDSTPAERSSSGVLVQRGAQAMCGLGLESLPAAVDLDRLLLSRVTDACFRSDAAESMAQRRSRDLALLQGIATRRESALSGVALRWMQAAPLLFPRALERAHLSDTNQS